MKHDLETALDQCLGALRNGTDVEGCLRRYPEYAEDLRPLLELVGHVGRVLPPPSSEAARAAGERRMLAALARRSQDRSRLGAIRRALRRAIYAPAMAIVGGWRPAWNLGIVIAMVMLIAALGVTAFAATESLPGDVLYPVKLAGQQFQLTLTQDAEKYQLLQDRFNTQQRLDIQAVLAGGGQARVEFQGMLQQVDGDLWIIGGLPVSVGALSEAGGQPSLGAVIRVWGNLKDGSVSAVEVGVTPLPTVPATATPVPTTTVDRADSQAPTDAPTPTGTPEPTDAPEPTERPRSTSTLPPTELPEAKETPVPTGTSQPTEEPEPKETPHDEETEEPELEETPDEEDEEESKGSEELEESPTMPEPGTETPEPLETPDD